MLLRAPTVSLPFLWRFIIRWGHLKSQKVNLLNKIIGQFLLDVLGGQEIPPCCRSIMIYPYTNLPTDSSRNNPKIDKYSQIINHQPTIRKPTSPAILRIHFDSGADQTIAYGHRLINGWSRCLHTQGSHQSLQLQAIVWIVIFPNKSEIQFVCMVPYTPRCLGGHQLYAGPSKSRGPHLPAALVLEPSYVAWKHFGRPPTARGNTSTVLFPMDSVSLYI